MPPCKPETHCIANCRLTLVNIVSNYPSLQNRRFGFRLTPLPPPIFDRFKAGEVLEEGRLQGPGAARGVQSDGRSRMAQEER